MREKLVIDANELCKLWESGSSMNALAKHFSCSVCAIRKRLFEAGVTDFSRSRVMQMKYDKEADSKWMDIKMDLDAGLLIDDLMDKHHMTKQRLLSLFERNGYDYEMQQQNRDKLALENKAAERDKLKKMLVDFRSNGKTVKQIAEKLGKSETTVGRYLAEFGLTHKADRTDIKDEDVLRDWENGMTVVQIAKKYDCSWDTISKRLETYDISCDRRTGIIRHFDVVHDAKWEAIKLDLDKCMPISNVAIKHGVRYESVYDLMERHDYTYAGLSSVDIVSLRDRIYKSTVKEESEYLQALLDCCESLNNPPVVYTLSKFMGKDMKTVRNAIIKYNLYEFIGNEGPSVKVLRVLQDLDALGISYEQNNRKILRQDNGRFMEIDVYLPDFQLGIEVNPTWTHSVDTNSRIDRLYHQKKSLLAESYGVGLLQMYDYDFFDDRMYSVFLTQMSSLVCEKQRIGARTCDVRVIDRLVLNDFCDKYHFQGGESSSFVQYGLFYYDVLVGVLSFGQSRYTSDAYEIIRYCMHPSYIVHGGFQKMFQAFMRQQSSGCRVVSYMDLNKRLIAKNVYEQNGFVLEKVTVPDYVWYNQSGSVMKSRYQTMKSELVRQGFDESKSESQIMLDEGYCRVYGAGSKRYVYTKS